MKTKITTTLLLVSLAIATAKQPVFAAQTAKTSEDDLQIEEPVTEPQDLENKEYTLTAGFFHKAFKNIVPAYNAFPLVLKMDTGRHTEADIAADIYTFQGNTTGPGDISVEFKWDFYKTQELNVGTLASLALPTGITAQTDNGFEPAGLLLAELDMGKGWSLSGNAGLACMHDPVAATAYTRWTYSGEAAWKPGSTAFYTAYAGFTPNASNGINIERIFLGAKPRLADNITLNAFLMRGIGAGDVSCSFGAFVTEKF